MNKFKLLVILSTASILIFFSSCQAGNSPVENFLPQRVAALNCSYGGQLAAVEAIDSTTVRFRLCSPDAVFPMKLSNPAFAILDEKILASTQGASDSITNQPTGTGPYTVDLFTSQALTLVANPNYWGVPVKSKTIVIQWNSDPFQRYSALEGKTADVVDNPDPNFYLSIRANSSYQLQNISSYSLYYIGFNNSTYPLDNIKVRQALAQYFDRTAMVVNYFPEGSTVAEQFVPATLYPGYTQSMKWYPRDAAQARKTLDTEYADRSKVLEIYYEEPGIGEHPNRSALAYYISSHLKSDLTFSVKLIPLDKATFEQNLKAGKLNFFLAKFDPFFSDAASFYNYAFIQNGKAFGTLDKNLISEVNAAIKSSNPVIRQGHYDVINQLIRDQVPIIPIGFVSSVVANSASVENVLLGAFNINFPEIASQTGTVTYMQTSKPLSLNPLDESTTDTLRATSLIYDTLTTCTYGGTNLQSSLADAWTSNEDLTQWTFNLHYGVKFNNGDAFDANDVVATFASIWDASNPYHIGRTGEFKIFNEVFGNFLNAPSP